MLTIKFHQARVQIRTRSENDVVIPQDQQLTKGHALCTSYCFIYLHGKKCLALWKTVNTSDNQVQVQQPPSDDCCNEEGCQPSTVNRLHELPFKVMGSCYSRNRQQALNNAVDCMYEYNRPVLATLPKG